MGKLYFRYGAMNSGKSTNLMQVAFNYEERGMRVLVLKPHSDTKGGNFVVSRLGVEREVDFSVETEHDIYEEVVKRIEENGAIDCILVDEVQFLKANQIDQLLRLAVKQDLPIICYGLRTDFLMNGFEGSSRLLLLAHAVEELKTICTCGKKALLNARKINGQFVFEGEQIAIDGENHIEYQSLCPKCYFELYELKKSEA